MCHFKRILSTGLAGTHSPQEVDSVRLYITICSQAHSAVESHAGALLQTVLLPYARD